MKKKSYPLLLTLLFVLNKIVNKSWIFTNAYLRGCYSVL